jgi:hypothetical protein
VSRTGKCSIPQANIPKNGKVAPTHSAETTDTEWLHTSRNTAQLLTGACLHEDPRYLRSTSSNPFVRTVHALAFTIFDNTDSGRTTFAASNFASAAAGGFVGMGILPDGYNEVTHAKQHMASEFLKIGIGNVLTEFEPQWGPWARKLCIPKLLAAGWVPEH